MAVFVASPLTDETIIRISGVSYRENPHIALSDLCELHLTHIGFDGQPHSGLMICNKELSDDLLWVFRELFFAGYRIEKIRLADDYGGNDDLIMADNCSSCFNYRCVDGTDTLSMHALGRAVDINPLYNPYITGGRILPPNGAEYADRSKSFPHKIDEDDICYKLFVRRGWKWGGSWKTEKDYQHFYKSK